MKLRHYQKDSVKALQQWLRRSVEPCLVEAATGAGKSYIIAALASWLNQVSGGKHVLCLAPSAELVVQNREKYLHTGEPASIFSASAGATDLRHSVVFGTPKTVKNQIRKFGSRFCAVIIDECHGITPTVKSIIDHMREKNPKLRVVGLSATPYRLGDGYVYQLNESRNPVGDYSAKNPYFVCKVHTVPARLLIDQGYLTPPVIGDINADSYNTSGMELQGNGSYKKQDVDAAYHGHGRKTSRIIADVVAKSQHRRGVILFAATVEHAYECMASLPPGLSAIVTGKTKRKDRADILRRFKAREIKYLVNVSVLTTGFDAEHVDVVALLRLTESAGLLQQMIGRGLRVADGKKDCLVLDYAENLERHCPDGDLFSPEIRAIPKSEKSHVIRAVCPACNAANEFSGRQNDEGYEVNESGYFVDLDRKPIETDHGPMPAHHGRRCRGMVVAGKGELAQCSYRWTGKECPHCGSDNDIAARYCADCRGELVDPNEKLRAEFRAHKKDPTRTQCDRIVSMDWRPTISRAGRECILVEYVTEYRKFKAWYVKDARHGSIPERKMSMWSSATGQGARTPSTITYRKQENGLYETLAFDQKPDEDPAQ